MKNTRARSVVLHAKNTELACPVCGRRLIIAIPTVAALCHHNHKAAVMQPVLDATSQPA